MKPKNQILLKGESPTLRHFTRTVISNYKLSLMLRYWLDTTIRLTRKLFPTIFMIDVLHYLLDSCTSFMICFFGVNVSFRDCCCFRNFFLNIWYISFLTLVYFIFILEDNYLKIWDKVLFFLRNRLEQVYCSCSIISEYMFFQHRLLLSRKLPSWTNLTWVSA